jgi:hypothetical protein
MHQNGLPLREQRVQIAFVDEPAEMADTAGHGHRQPERRRDHAEQHLNVAETPAAERCHVSHQRPPEDKEREVVERHEHNTHDESAAQRQCRLEVGRDERPRERQAV